MGTVYEGFDPVIGRRVAIKALRTTLFEASQMPTVLDRFRREAQSAGGLSHPNIVTIHDFGQDMDIPYIVMEFISGADLGKALSSGVRFSVDEIGRMMLQLLDALGAAHDSGVVHRDLKPANIFLRDDGSLKVVDFGIAHVESSNLTRTEVMLGTPAYMSPEQCLGSDVDQRSDLFSAGVILYELLAGERPFTGSLVTVTHKILNLDPVPPTAINAALAPTWDRLVARALSKDRAGRFESARQFSDAIREQLRIQSPASNGSNVPTARPSAETSASSLAVTHVDSPLFDSPQVSSLRPEEVPLAKAAETQVEPPPRVVADQAPREASKSASRRLPLFSAIAGIAVVGVFVVGMAQREQPNLPVTVPPKVAATDDIPPVIKIGLVREGEDVFAKDIENGARLAIDEANAKGASLGGRPVKYELVVENVKKDPADAAAVASKLVEAKVAGVVVGDRDTAGAIVASAIYSSAGIPMIAAAASDPKITGLGHKTSFRTFPRDDTQGAAVARFLVVEVKAKQVAIIDDSTRYGEGLANEAEKTLKAAGVRVLVREKGTEKTRDWRSILTRIKGMGPDAIFYGSETADSAVPLVSQGRALGIKAVFAFGDAGCETGTFLVIGAAANGLLCSSNGISLPWTSRRFREAFASRRGSSTSADLFAPYAYDSVNLLLASMREAGSPDPAKYLPKLAKASLMGATGRLEFDEKGDRKEAGVTILRRLPKGLYETEAVVLGDQIYQYDAYLAMIDPPVAASGRTK